MAIFGSLSPDLVTSAYQTYLGRAPDEAGLQGALSGGGSYQDLISGIAGSPEYRQKTIQDDYQSLFGRPADQGGVDYWNNSGQSLSDIWSSLLESPEARTFLASSGFDPTGTRGTNVDPNYLSSDVGLNAQVETRPSRTFSQLPQLTDDQITQIGRAVSGEALGEGPEGWQAVANNIRNRMVIGNDPYKGAAPFGSNLNEILDPRQYNGANAPIQDQQKYNQILDVVRNVFSGTLGDNTNGSTFYYANKGANAIGAPGWAKIFGPQNSTQVGNQIFMGRVPDSYYDTPPTWAKPAQQQQQPVPTPTPRPDFPIGPGDFPDANLGAFDGLRATQTGFTPQVMGQDGYTSTGANIINSVYNGGTEYGFYPIIGGGGMPAPQPANPFPTSYGSGTGITPATPQNSTPNFGGSGTTPGTDFWGSLSPTWNYGGDYLGF